MGILTPCRSETPENFITKIGHIDYVAGATRMPNFMGIGLGKSAPTNSQNITSCDFVYLPFPFLSFPFLPFPFFLVVASIAANTFPSFVEFRNDWSHQWLRMFT